MTRIRLALSLFVALAFLTPQKYVEAQEPSQATANDGSKLPMKLTENVLTAFAKGLEVERDRRRAIVKRLASLKTPEDFNSCQQALGASPEAQKIIMAPGNLPETATTEEVQKALEKVQTDLAKLLAERCGENPHPYQAGWRQQQIDSAEAAGRATFEAALGITPIAGGPFLGGSRRQQIAAAEVARAETFAAGLGVATSGYGPQLTFDHALQLDIDFYRLLKEWVPPFCNMSKSAQQAATEKGILIPGNGKGIFFVYTAEEARFLLKQCDGLMKVLNEML